MDILLRNYAQFRPTMAEAVDAFRARLEQAARAESLFFDPALS
jgi:hypothetical protein